MAGLGLDPNQDRVTPRLTGLETRGELEAVSRHHAIIVVACCHQGAWILPSRLESMIGRVGIEGSEFLRILRRPIVTDPGPSNRKLIKAKHVHHADSRQGRAKKLRSLRQASPNQETAIASSANRQATR